MWNTKSDTFGWNLDRNIPTKCNYLNKDNKCILTSLLNCDYRRKGKCTQCKTK